MDKREFNSKIAAGCRHFIEFAIILLFVFSANFAVAESKNASAYQGNISGEWSGDVMGAYVGGTLSMSISADGNIAGSLAAAGSILGSEPVMITGVVSADGNVKAKSSSALSEWEWTGKLTISNGRLSGSGLFRGSGSNGAWSSK